ncbi:M48 family metalloprotease [Amycolatopsis sp. CA-128772]|uniref:M48 family metalloprotease n=1 Tax=Amycolatopsis sp. CA-128772 TaxID=2073159 RepID=UPI000CD019D5|nr:M48 family metalloprotease [Amycolatopsis sp. CA-128772]
MPNRTGFLGSTLAAAGTAAALALATAVPAAAAAPATVEQDVDQLYQDVIDLYNGLPADALRGVDRLVESPIPRIGPQKQSQAADGPIPGCTEGSLLTYANKLAASLSPLEGKALDALSGLSQLYVQGVASDKTPQVFGTDGQYTARATASIDKLRGFWDIESWNIQLVAWKGTDLGSQAKMAQTFGLGLAPAKVKAAAALATKVLYEVPAMQGGRNPLLTLNAFAAPAGSLGGKRVALGDGLLDTVDVLGFDDVSVESVVGHEYGHQVDFAHDNHPRNESSEMGPDAYGGYFVAHAKGFGWNARTQQEVTYLDASIGDCYHSHGTPDQRKAAGAWGEKQATSQANPNRIIPSATMIEKFQKVYPKLMPPVTTQPAGARG